MSRDSSGELTRDAQLHHFLADDAGTVEDKSRSSASNFVYELERNPETKLASVRGEVL